MKRRVFFIICFALLSAYPIYRNYYYGRALEQYERHVQFMEVNSRFHNPWQYRIFSPLSVELIKNIYDLTLDKILPIEKLLKLNINSGASSTTKKTVTLFEQLKNPDFIKYNLIYSVYRFALNLLLYYLVFLYLKHFIKNNWLIFLGLILTGYFFGNAVTDSDFTLHTYIDNVLYLCAALVILKGKNQWYILLLTILGACNRETSLLIPFLFLVSHIDWNGWRLNNFAVRKFPFPKSQVIVITALCGVCFIAIFVSIRWYYGYEPATQWKVPAGLPMLKFNLASVNSIKSYFEMLGLFSIIPLVCLYKFKQTDFRLRVWFLALVPIWFMVHWVAVVAYQPRLFLVPTLLLFLPMLLQIIEGNNALIKDAKVSEIN
ncbi:MAG: hypothetical protein ACFB2Y_17820 [Fulvivirga sp.]|mgnify:CR=1 FL=1